MIILNLLNLSHIFAVVSLVTYSRNNLPDLICYDRFDFYRISIFIKSVNTRRPLTWIRKNAFLCPLVLEFCSIINIDGQQIWSYQRAALLVGSESLQYFFAYSIMNLWVSLRTLSSFFCLNTGRRKYNFNLWMALHHRYKVFIVQFELPTKVIFFSRFSFLFLRKEFIVLCPSNFNHNICIQISLYFQQAFHSFFKIDINNLLMNQWTKRLNHLKSPALIPLLLIASLCMAVTVILHGYRCNFLNRAHYVLASLHRAAIR